MTPPQIALVAEKLREHYGPPHPAMTPTRYVAHEVSQALAAALDAVADEVGLDAPTEGRAEPYVDEAMLRREALDAAVRAAPPRGAETPQQLVERAQAFEAFLRGDPVAAVTSVFGEGSDLDVLEGLLAFVRTRTFEDASGLRSLEGAAVQAEAASYLEPVSHEQLRMMRHVLSVARSLVSSALEARQ